jgi:AcrR family transcriptional regulator
VTRDQLLTETLALLEEGGLAAVTMRALARRLAIDPMTVYQYVDDKDALLRAAAARAYERLEVPSVRGDWRARLTALALAYVAMLARARELLRYVTGDPDAVRAPVRAFDVHFRAAIAPLRLGPRAHAAAQGAFVDVLHGFALAGRIDPPLLRRELRVILAGIAAMS